MLTLPRSVRIFLAGGVTDLRKSIDRLSVIVSGRLAADPLSGHLFVFCNRRRDRIKVLFWDRTGFWIMMKRLEEGTFDWPERGTARVELTWRELTALLEGIDLKLVKTRKRYCHNEETVIDSNS